MKSAIAVSLAALSLVACSPSEPAATNLSDNEVTLNEADIPAEDNAGADYGNSTLGFDNSLDNAAAVSGNDVLANSGVTTNLN
jgi:hypothetical protein